MSDQAKKNSTVTTAGGGYKSGKSTEIYEAETAPINYQNSETSTEEVYDKPQEIKHVVLDSEEPDKEINVQEDFLNSITQVYISGQYVTKGHTTLRVKEVIALLLKNTGSYHIVVNPSLKQPIIDIIKYAKDSVLGRGVSKYERDTIISLFKHDNNIK
jgi:hypothetical protein